MGGVVAVAERDCHLEGKGVGRWHNGCDGMEGSREHLYFKRPRKKLNRMRLKRKRLEWQPVRHILSFYKFLILFYMIFVLAIFTSDIQKPKPPMSNSFAVSKGGSCRVVGRTEAKKKVHTEPGKGATRKSGQNYWKDIKKNELIWRLERRLGSRSKKAF